MQQKQQIIKQHIKHETIRHLEDHRGQNLDVHGYSNDILHTPPKVQSKKERINKRDFIKVLNFGSMKDTAKRMRRLGESICKEYISKIYTEPLKNNSKKEQPDQIIGQSL